MPMYEPREDSELLKKYVKKFAFGNVLDMGTGSGIQAEEAAKKKEVKSVLAVDIDKKTIEYCKKNIKNKKTEFAVSNLFSKINQKFNTIIFNPPYLPQDLNIKDQALYGGKKGYEVLERFLNQINEHLEENGMGLILFSSFTNKNQINEILERNLLEFKELEKTHIFFEDLFVYLIKKNKILKELNQKKIEKIRYLAHGKRGNVFIGIYKKKKIIIKTKRKESKAEGRIQNEIKYLKILNKKGIGPRLLSHGKSYLIEEFVRGTLILGYFEKQSIKEKRAVMTRILKQCFEMDRLGINKEEMHRPIKHVLINKRKTVLIDFERCYKTEKPHNVTQFSDFLIRLNLVNKEKMIKLLREYKIGRKEGNFKEILRLVEK